MMAVTSEWAAYAPLALAIAAVWLPSFRLAAFVIPAWIPPYAVAVSAALYLGVLEPIGAASLVVLFGLGALVHRSTSRSAKCIALLALGAFALALALHALPGFVNPKLLDDVSISEAAPRVTQYLKFDKASAGLALLIFCVPLASTAQHWGVVLRVAAIVGAVTVTLTAATGLALGYFDFDIKQPPQMGALLMTQLFFTCAAEEAFFRGFLQERMHRALMRWRPLNASLLSASLAAVSVSTLLFALVHLRGGWPLVLLAAMSGAGAAVAYAMTRRVEAAILIHFAVNATHLFAFTYPYRL